MKLAKACNEILLQLSNLVDQLTDDEFQRPLRSLSNATVGQHLRHTLEFFICFEKGYVCGTINYDRRNHDKTIETNRRLAADTIARILNFVSGLEENRPVTLEVSYDLEGDESEVLESTIARELVYNIEHAVHHMAIIKIGINEMAPQIKLPAGFGVAVSTIRHKQTVASSN